MCPVAVRLAPPRRVPLAVIAAAQALAVPDHVVARDRVATREPERQRKRGSELPGVAEDLTVARADVLDADRGPVQPDRVAADERQSHELVDRSVAIDDEVHAR